MTDVVLVCQKNGCFKSCRAKGHADFSVKGKDIVCAAESVILRTSVELLEQTEGVGLKVNASARGSLEFFVEACSSVQAEERLKCVGDLIRLAFSELSAEYPRNVRFKEIFDECPDFPAED